MKRVKVRNENDTQSTHTPNKILSYINGTTTGILLRNLN